MKHILSFLLFCLFVSPSAKAVKFMGLRVIDKNYLMVHLRDGEVRYSLSEMSRKDSNKVWDAIDEIEPYVMGENEA